ncbi:unnamed protein product [Mytilus coruscus]|uniref:Uncharacterized protein n=1 Tax=Mytilus coruscus TaxID=42192 RepID=A0A6J8BJW0_MYTCO|nr:unnamed protein product [Mytilus coruscus]
MIPRTCTLTIQSQNETPKITSEEMLHYINSEINLDISALIGYFQSTGINKFLASFRDEHSKEIFQDVFRDQFEVKEIVQSHHVKYGVQRELTTITRANRNESLSTQESQDSQENTIVSSGEIEVEIYQDKDTMEAAQTSTSDSTPIEENLNESKSSNESIDHEIIITQALEVKFDKLQSETEKIKE